MRARDFFVLLSSIIIAVAVPANVFQLINNATAFRIAVISATNGTAVSSIGNGE